MDFGWDIGRLFSLNWIEWLLKDFCRITEMCEAVPNEELVKLLMGKVAFHNQS